MLTTPKKLHIYPYRQLCNFFFIKFAMRGIHHIESHYSKIPRR
nr:MAG TPA: hypothetical protein [Caudoviricetes sp.]